MMHLVEDRVKLPGGIDCIVKTDFIQLESRTYT